MQATKRKNRKSSKKQSVKRSMHMTKKRGSKKTPMHAMGVVQPIFEDNADGG